ncbi:GIY-YIG nuclease family protein [Phormidium nigroviride]
MILFFFLKKGRSPCRIEKLRSLPILMTDDQQPEARQILNVLTSIPFEQCQPLDRNFASIPPRPGLYAVRHRTEGLLYIGKTKSLRGRFTGGHKAFLWAWLDLYSHEDVRLSFYILSPWKNPTLLLELEAIILRSTEPPYNALIPMER